MKIRIIPLLVVFILCSCAQQNTLGRATGFNTSTPTLAPAAPESYQPRCGKMSLIPIKTRMLYEDYYGTMITSDPSFLKGRAGSYRWGITNPKPSEMAYFSAYVKPGGKYRYFRTYVHIDSSIKDTMVFLFRNNDREGEVLKQLSIDPGQTKVVDIEITGVKKLFIGSELRINHGKGTRMILGEPEFYNCR